MVLSILACIATATGSINCAGAQDNPEKIITFTETAEAEKSVGALRRADVAKISQLIREKRFEEAEAQLTEVLNFFAGKMSDADKQYYSFTSSAQLALYKKQHPETKSVIWLDDAYGNALHHGALLEIERGELDKALEWLDREIAARPLSASPFNERGYIFNLQKKPRLALKAYRSAAELAKQDSNSKPVLAIALRGIGYAASELGDMIGARQAYLQSLEIEPKNVLAQRELQWIDQTERRRLEQSALSEIRSGKFDDAAESMTAMLDIDTRLHGPHSDTVVETLGFLVRLHEKRLDADAGLEARRRIVAAKEKRLGKEHWQTVDERNKLAYSEKLVGLSKRENELFSKMLALKAQERESVELNDNLSAARFREQTLPIEVEIFGEFSWVHAIGQQDFGYLLREDRQFIESEKALRYALRLQERVQSTSHPGYALTLRHLGWSLFELDQLEEAEACYLKALKILEETYGKEHEKTLEVVNDLAEYYRESGQYERAELLYLRSMQTRRKVFAPDDVRIATAANNLARLYVHMDDPVRAMPFAKEAYATYRKQDKRSRGTTIAMTNLGEIYQMLGDYEQAERFALKSLKVREEVHGKKSVHYALALNNTAHRYHESSRFDLAETRYREALEIYEQHADSNQFLIATIKANLGALLHSSGRDEEAIKWLVEAMEGIEKARGKDHARYTTVLSNIGNVFLDNGRYQEALPVFSGVTESFREQLGEDHTDYATSLQNLAKVKHCLGQHKEGELDARRAVEIFRQHIDESFEILSERQQLALTASMRGTLDTYLSLTANDPQHDQLAFQNVSAWKGSVFLTQYAGRLSVEDEQSAQLVEQLRASKRRYERWITRSGKFEDEQARQEKRIDLQNEIEALESQLAQRGRRLLSQFGETTPQDLSESLPENVVLVDFIEYSPFVPPHERIEQGEAKSSRQLAAFVLQNGQPIVRLELGDVAPIEVAVQTWRQELKKLSSVKFDEAASELRRRIVQPLAGHFVDAKIVLLSPDGVVNRIPFAALPGKRPGTFMLEDVGLATVPIVRMVPQMLNQRRSAVNDESSKALSVLLVGDVDFDARTSASDGDGDGVDHLLADRSFGQFAKLPGTKREINAIRKTLESLNGKAMIQVLSGKQASESNFRKHASNKQVIHLATHGFFAPTLWTSALGTASESSRGLQLIDEEQSGQQVVEAHGLTPGMLSGIAFAGANQLSASAEENDTVHDNGILFAMETSELKLENTELAVLSACETALGPVAGGECVLGLQRAFQMAGAKSTITSLWKVDDRATELLMVEFYRNLWVKDLDKLEALRRAQLTMINRFEPATGELIEATGGEEQNQNESGKRLAPYYWAAFVLSGDWR